MGRPRKFTPEELETAWGLYKTDCNNQTVLTHEFSAKNSQFVSKDLRRSVTYTIEGFCVFLGLARSTFYEHYDGVEGFTDIITRIREECEIDARKKFELGVIPSQLAGLWMSKHGYSVKTTNTVMADVNARLINCSELTTEELRRLAALEETSDSESSED